MFRVLLWRLPLLPCTLALAGVLLPSSSAQQNSSPVQEHFVAAQQDQQQGLLDAAAQEYQTVLRLQPGLPEAYVNLGLVYYAQSKLDESARALTAAGKLRPGMRGISLWLGIDYVRLNRPLQGVALLREAVRLNPADKLAQSWLGTALWNAGQMDAALLQLRASDARFPNDPDFVFALGEAYGKAASQQTEQLLEESSGTALSDLIYGTIYAGERDWPKAEGHLRRAIERDSNLLQAHLDLAAVFIEQARLAAAQQQMDQALLLAPRSAAALARSGELLLLQKQPAEGLARIAKAIDIDRSEALDALGLPGSERVDRTAAGDELPALCRDAARNLETDATSSPAKAIALAALYSLTGDADAALRNYQRIAPHQYGPDRAANAFSLAMKKLHQHRYDDAEPLFVRWIAAHPEDRTARYQLALARRQISLAQISRLLAIAPDSYHVHQLLGQLYASREEDDKALAEYLAVAAARPDLPGIHFWLGHLYWKHGDADHGFAELTRELQLDPDHPEANGELGAVLVAEERAAEAIPHLESAIRSKPDLWPAYPQLGRAYALQKDYLRAEQVLRRGLAHDQDASTHYQLALVLRSEGKTAQAAQVFAQVRAIKSEKMASPLSENASEQGEKQ
ncbi:MAG: tetratricopeptide repeat protein [Terracidiphilus sp.]|nr:tetratricopeptide repeat protein [Terracidiphilus sp.]